MEGLSVTSPEYITQPSSSASASWVAVADQPVSVAVGVTVTPSEATKFRSAREAEYS